MKKLLFLLAIIVLVSSSLFATITYSQNIPVSFTYDIVANYGFTTRRISDFLKPDSLSEISDSTVMFKYDSAKKKIKTDDFYFYYQIFTPDKVVITMKLEDLKNGTNTVGYSSLASYSFADSSVLESGKSYTIYSKDKTAATEVFSPVVSSSLLSFVIKDDDVEKIDWNEEYTAAITLSMVVTE